MVLYHDLCVLFDLFVALSLWFGIVFLFLFFLRQFKSFIVCVLLRWLCSVSQCFVFLFYTQTTMHTCSYSLINPGVSTCPITDALYIESLTFSIMHVIIFIISCQYLGLRQCLLVVLQVSPLFIQICFFKLLVFCIWIHPPLTPCCFMPPV